jgi:hypothetical protein
MKGLRKYSFKITKKAKASMGNVIINYFDLEHIAIHPDVVDINILAESDRACCYVLSSRMLGIPMHTLNYYEYLPPGQVVQVAKNWMGIICTDSRCTEHRNEEGTIEYSEVDITVTLWLKWWAYPLRRILERLLVRFNQKLLLEDLPILEGRQSQTGDYVLDYLRPEQPTLFKEMLQKSFSKDGKPVFPDSAGLDSVGPDSKR